MGLLTTLLTLPVSGPLKGVLWIAEQVRDIADEQVAAQLQREFAELERARLFGEIDEEEYRLREEELWGRMQEAASGNGHHGETRRRPEEDAHGD